jgi:hypothetical protein
MAGRPDPSTKWRSCSGSRCVAAGPHVLVRWAVRDASGDTWEPLDNTTNLNCEEAISAFVALRALAGNQTLPSLPRPPPTGRRCRRPTPALPPGRLHCRRSTARGPGRTALGADAALLVARLRMAGSVAACQWPVPARVGPSRTWWLTTGRRRPCAGRRTRCSTRPRTAPGPAGRDSDASLSSPAPAAGVRVAARVVSGQGQAMAAGNDGRQI